MSHWLSFGSRTAGKKGVGGQSRRFRSDNAFGAKPTAATVVRVAVSDSLVVKVSVTLADLALVELEKLCDDVEGVCDEVDDVSVSLELVELCDDVDEVSLLLDVEGECEEVEGVLVSVPLDVMLSEVVEVGVKDSVLSVCVSDLLVVRVSVTLSEVVRVGDSDCVYRGDLEVSTQRTNSQIPVLHLLWRSWSQILLFEY